jgi:hypothetical protein
MDENHQPKRMSLEDAASEVGVSKKSLDDYLSQLRQGRQFGFDFNSQKDGKVGVLRQFVKEHTGIIMDDDDSDEEGGKKNVGKKRKKPAK